MELIGNKSTTDEENTRSNEEVEHKSSQTAQGRNGQTSKETRKIMVPRKILILIGVFLAAAVQAGNDTIVNTTKQPVPVSVVKGTFNVSGSFNPTIPVITSAGNDTTLSNNSDGSQWVVFASHAAKQIMIYNKTGTEVSIRYGSGTPFPVPDNGVVVWSLINNTNELQFRRSDTANTQVTLYWHFEG